MTESVEWLGEKTTSTESGAVYGYVGGLWTGTMNQHSTLERWTGSWTGTI